MARTAAPRRFDWNDMSMWPVSQPSPRKIDWILADSDSEDEQQGHLGSLRSARRFQQRSSEIESRALRLPQPDSAKLPRQELGDFVEALHLVDGHATDDATATSSLSTSPEDAKSIEGARSLSPAAYLTPPSSPDLQTPAPSQHKSKLVRWTESVANGSDSESSSSNEIAPITLSTSHNLAKGRRLPPHLQLIPSSIIPSTLPRQPRPNSDEISPLFTLTLPEKQEKLIRKLSTAFPDEPQMQLARQDPTLIMDLAANTSQGGIHIFVDLSNIIIGFAEQLKADRNIPKESRRRQPPLAFHTLAMVFERGRPVARRIVAGSTVTKEGRAPSTPTHVSEAGACGYELNILERVRKLKPVKTSPYKPTHHHTKAAARGARPTGYSSTSDSAATVLTNAEQGVDELLHLKMMESVLDAAAPATMVVASGDAAHAEYSGGFLAMITRALTRGWRVEVVAWRSGLSSEYRNPAFLERWAGQFRVILLDHYVEEMLAIYADRFVFGAGAETP